MKVRAQGDKEMDAIRHLTEVLKSQVALYSELCELIEHEKEAITTWAVDKTVEITKKKEEILRREHIQQKARKLLLEQIAQAHDSESATISDVIKYAEGSEYSGHLEGLCAQLVELIKKIHAENLSLRMLYTTNCRMINDFFSQAGLSDMDNTYAPGMKNNKKVSTMYRIG